MTRVAKYRMINSLLGILILLSAQAVFAQDQKTLPKGMTPEKLEKSVIKTLEYVDNRLLSGTSAERIEQSGIDEAIAILQRSRKQRFDIAALINEGKFESAYWALKDLNKDLKEAIKLSRAKERKQQITKDKLASARTISDAYNDRAVQRGIDQGDGGNEALALFEQAQEYRTKASSDESNNKYEAAIASYRDSTQLLKSAVASARKQGIKRDTPKKEATIGARAEAEKNKKLPKGMTPAKLEKSVTKTLDYIDNRLLSGTNAKRIEQSGSKRAISLLQKCRNDREDIAHMIDQGQFETAYWELKTLNKSIKEALQLSRAEEVAAQKAKDEIDSARTINDAYQERAKQRGIDSGKGGDDALTLYNLALEGREQAQRLEKAYDYISATGSYKQSTTLLKKAITTARRYVRSND